MIHMKGVVKCPSGGNMLKSPQYPTRQLFRPWFMHLRFPKWDLSSLVLYLENRYFRFLDETRSLVDLVLPILKVRTRYGLLRVEYGLRAGQVWVKHKLKINTLCPQSKTKVFSRFFSEVPRNFWALVLQIGYIGISSKTRETSPKEPHRNTLMRCYEMLQDVTRCYKMLQVRVRSRFDSVEIAMLKIRPVSQQATQPMAASSLAKIAGN